MGLPIICMLIVSLILLPLCFLVLELMYVDLTQSRIRMDILEIYGELLTNANVDQLSKGNLLVGFNVERWISHRLTEKYPHCSIEKIHPQTRKGQWSLELFVDVPYLTINQWLGIDGFKHEVRIRKKVVLPFH